MGKPWLYCSGQVLRTGGVVCSGGGHLGGCRRPPKGSVGSCHHPPMMHGFGTPPPRCGECCKSKSKFGVSTLGEEAAGLINISRAKPLQAP